MSQIDPTQQNNSSFIISYTNTGTAGGTGYYINLGGMKMCWGITGSILAATSFGAGANVGIIFPASFFSTVHSVTVTNAGVANAAGVFCSVSGYTASAINFYVMENGTTGSVSGVFSWFVIGT